MDPDLIPRGQEPIYVLLGVCFVDLLYGWMYACYLLDVFATCID
jgi:hypothetical protein